MIGKKTEFENIGVAHNAYISRTKISVFDLYD